MRHRRQLWSTGGTVRWEAVAVRLQFIPRKEPPDLLDLPWATPLVEWDHPRLVQMAKGPSRHVVRFVRDGDRVYALEETVPADAEREYAMLRLLAEANAQVTHVVRIREWRPPFPAPPRKSGSSARSMGDP